MPPLPTRLMAGLAILKHTFNLSDEELCARWIENPYFQYLCGEAFFCHALPFDRSSLTRWRQRMGEDRIAALLQESLHVAVKTGAMMPSDTRRVVVDTTVQPKNVMFPTDAKLINRAREKLVKLARKSASICASPMCGSHIPSTLSTDHLDAASVIAVPLPSAVFLGHVGVTGHRVRLRCSVSRRS